MLSALAIAGCLLLRAAPPAAPPPVVPVVARATWDPRPAHPVGVTRYRGALRRHLRWIVVHHSSFEEPVGPQGILAYHRQVYGWSDIGYHFVIDQAGTVYEGRDLRLMGAHAGQSRECNRQVAAIRAGTQAGSLDDARRLDPDHGAIGVVLDGFFDGDRAPTLAQQAALRALLDDLRARYRIGGERVITHREVRARIVEAQGLTPVGEPTECPGVNLQRVVEAYRRAHTAAPEVAGQRAAAGGGRVR